MREENACIEENNAVIYSQLVTKHQIDPCHSYSTPGLTWEVGLKFTGINLKSLTDYYMYLMFEQERQRVLTMNSANRKKC